MTSSKCSNLVPSLLRFKDFAQDFAQVVEADDGQQDQQAGERRQIGSSFNVSLGVAEHAAPGCRGRADAQTEKAERRFHQDGVGNVHGCRHNDGGHDVGQNMVDDGGDGFLARDLGIDHIFPFIQRDGLAADDAGNVHPGQKADDQHHVLDTGFQIGVHDHHDQEGGQAHQCIHQTHQYCIHNTAHKAADGTDDDAQQRGENHGQKAHQKRGAAAVNAACQIVTAHIVGAEGMGQAGQCPAVHTDGIGVHRVKGRQQRNQCKQQNQHHTGDGQFVGPKAEFDVFPDIAGIIVSLGTRESPVSIAANRCHCDLCQNTTDLEWYTKVIRAMYEPIHNNGKDLIVRDFAYTAEQQSLMIQACEAVSDDIIIALKAEPHDYYPTFPDNPEIGNTGKLREYIEFDTWGQFFGMGVAPMSLAEDIQRRLINAYEKKADGVWFRTDWELINDACVHCTPSLVNLYAGAMLSFNLDTPLDDVYRRWISEGLYSPMKTASQPQIQEHPSNPEAWKYFRDFMKASWKAFSKIGYVLGHQYLESDQAPYTIEKAFEVMVVIHSRDDWDPGASSRVSVTKENMEKIFAEKQEGIKETKALLGILSPDTLGLSESFCSDIKASIQGMEDFAIFCDVVTRAMYLTSYAEKTHAADDIAAAVSTEKELRKIADDFEKRYQNTEYPYYLYSRLHPARIRRFADNVALHISRIGKE